jgi:hypothetical protein
VSDLAINHAAEIMTLHTAIVEAGRTALDNAIRIGELLAAQKASLGHGDFGSWCRGNLPFTERTARRYMQVYEARDRLKRTAVSVLGDAYRMIGVTTKTKALPAAASPATSPVVELSRYVPIAGVEGQETAPADDHDKHGPPEVVTAMDAKTLRERGKVLRLATEAINALKGIQTANDDLYNEALVMVENYCRHNRKRKGSR